MAKENIFEGWDKATIKKFNNWQLRTILVSMVGYAIYYFVRKNFSIAMPGLTAQYGISNTSFGIVIGIGSLVYGFSRFINGFVVDRFSARVIMAIGLLLCAASNLAFGFGVNISQWITGGENVGIDFINILIMVMAVTIILNQLFQGVGYPPCARLLPSWIHPSQLATKMSIWNTSHSIGASLAVVVCGYIMGTMGTDMSSDHSIILRIAENLNLDPNNSEHLKTIMGYARHWDAWKWCFWIPAGIAVCGALWLYLGLRDDPRSVGLPELPGTKLAKSDDVDTKKNQSAFLKVMVWTNRWIWTLCIANIFVYVMRMGILDWGPKFLTESRGMSIEDAAWSVGVFEIFAIVGTIGAGWATDHLFKGKAHRMCLVCMVCAVLFMGIFIFCPSLPVVVSICVLAMAGFFIYGPQALIGIASANHATKQASATANGLAGIFGYVGSFLSAIGIGIVADKWGWEMVFYLIIGVGVLGAITFLTMWFAPRDGYERSNKFYAELTGVAKEVNKIEGDTTNEGDTDL